MSHVACSLQYSLAYACLKLVNYSFFFWLPFYLSSNYGWKEAEADRLSTWYDVGGIFGEQGAWGTPNQITLSNILASEVDSFVLCQEGPFRV